jgi:AraC-like DNA-binding protein
LQYQKQLRLQEARLLMLNQNHDAGSAAGLVGYESASQFSRVNRTGLAITVCHFPRGTSKWNRIEHRLFSYIAMNWRGTPLVNLPRS